MKIDPAKSVYREIQNLSPAQFTRQEKRRLRILLRRLRFLEAKVAAATEADASDPSAWVQLAEAEMDALEWVLVDIEFLYPRKEED